MQITPLSFGKNYISEVSARNNETKTAEALDFVEYEYSFYDLAHLDDSTKRQKGGADIFINYVDAYLNGHGKNKKFYGLENKEGKVQAVLESDTKGGMKEPAKVWISERSAYKGLQDKIQIELSKLN